MGTFEELGKKTDKLLHGAKIKSMELYGAAMKQASIIARKASEGARDAAAKVENSLHNTDNSEQAAGQQGVNLHKDR